MSEFRVVHAHLTSQPLVVRSRTVMLDENGATEPLTEDEHAYLVSIPIFTCAARIQGEPCPLCDAVPVVAPGDEPLEGEALAEKVREIFGDPDPDDFDGEIACGIGFPLPAETEDDGFEDLFNAWLDMDESERCETVSALEEHGADDFLLRTLFDFEGARLNGPRALAALDTALGRLQPKKTPEQINTELVKQSARGGPATKNPPVKKR